MRAAADAVPDAAPKPAAPPPLPTPDPTPDDGKPKPRSGPTLRDRMNEIADNQQAHFESEHLRVLLSSGYDMDDYTQDAGAVVCVPGDRRARGMNWIGVRAVRVGTRPGVVDRTVPVNLDWDRFVATGEERLTGGSPPTDTSGRPRPPHGWEIWHAKLPVDAKAVYVRFEFRDGTTGDELRFDVEPTPDDGH